MKMLMPLVAILAAISLACAARAACSDDIAAFETHLDSVGRTAGAATSSGQATSAQRGEKAKEARDTETPAKDLPTPPTSDNIAATQQAAQAGGGGDRVMRAKVTLNDAKNARRKGDEKACLEAVGKAKTELSD